MLSFHEAQHLTPLTLSNDMADRRFIDFEIGY
jgi:hypothetical protein